MKKKEILFALAMSASLGISQSEMEQAYNAFVEDSKVINVNE